MELPIDNKSFYDLPKIGPKGSDTEPEGPVKDIPGRTETTPFDYTFMKQMIPAKPSIKPTPENDPRSWNSGGNGNWWDVFQHESHLKGKTPINGKG